jgi:hypothetical protein
MKIEIAAKRGKFGMDGEPNQFQISQLRFLQADRKDVPKSEIRNLECEMVTGSLAFSFRSGSSKMASAGWL